MLHLIVMLRQRSLVLFAYRPSGVLLPCDPVVGDSVCFCASCNSVGSFLQTDRPFHMNWEVSPTSDPVIDAQHPSHFR